MRTTKTNIGLLLFVLIFLTVNYSCKTEGKKTVEAESQPEIIQLFNGNDLTGLNIFVEDSTLDKSTVFYVKDSMLVASGIPNGYIYTTSEYEEYKLVVEWAWLEEESNSGVFMHLIGNNKIWPQCFEAQLKAGNAGDLIASGGSGFSGLPEGEKVQSKFNVSNEKPAGEFNKYEIICNADSIIVYVNGELQNKATGLSHTKGKIGLQSEGTPIGFRSFYLEKL
ncbi:MAG: DUF1080 domain-containing protein [Bacteroidales bacterium]|nr:DUF1080 domain-containing protein [Bacteroidales bacterium]